MNHAPEAFPILVLYPHSRCNCRCVMCDIWKVTDATEITATELARHMDDIAALHVEWVVFSGGEPLMHSDLFRLAQMLSARGIRTTLLTTGLLLARHAERICESINDVIVSLDGPPGVHNAIRGVPNAFESLAEGVRSLRTIQPAYPIAARSTVQRSNMTCLRETVRTAREVSLNSISFLAADLTSTAFNRPLAWPEVRQSEVAPNLTEIAILEAEIEALIEQESGRGFVLESPGKLRRIVRHFRAHLGLELPVAPACNAPWVSTVVEADGTVRPCFFHAPIGNWNDGGLRAALHSPAAIEFRRTLDVSTNPTCRRCVCSLLHRA